MGTSIKPNVHRKCWVWGVDGLTVLDPKQPFDATILFVHEDGTLNLSVYDHEGNEAILRNVPLRDGRADDSHMNVEMHACWSPFQVGQAGQASGATVPAKQTPNLTGGPPKTS